MHLVTLSWVRVSLNRQESLGANEGRFCRNRHLSGLMFWLVQQKTVNAGLVVFTDGIELGGGVLPCEDGEASSDRMSLCLEKCSF